MPTSPRRARRRGTPPASLCEAAQCSHWVVRSEAKLRWRGQRPRWRERRNPHFSLPQSASPTAPSQRGPRKRSPPQRAKNRPFAAHKTRANVRTARVKIGAFSRRTRRNLRYTNQNCYNNLLYRAEFAVTPAFHPSELRLQTG